MAKIAEDGSYASFIIDHLPDSECPEYVDCRVVVAPFSSFAGTGGAGWLFPKRSPFLPIFNYYFWIMKGSGAYGRIMKPQNRPGYNPMSIAKQQCENLEGKPIGIHKSFSVFVILMTGLCLSILIFL